MNASAPIEDQIAAVMRKMSAEDRVNLRRAARKYNVMQTSLIWLLVDVYDSGHMRSNAFADAPRCVVDDGLIYERL